MSDIQDRIAAARREAEGLKAKIKIKKEELADADCEHKIRANVQKRTKFRGLTIDKFYSATTCERDSRASTTHQYESTKNLEGSSREDLRNALVDG